MNQPSGKVFLVGSGLGDSRFLTVQAQQLLTEAEVVIYDALVEKDLVQWVPETCLKLDVGKRGGQPSTPQAKINQLLVQHCREGKRVVRLKSGDPFIFGRVQAEIQALTEANCAFEVVPGLSSALTAPLLAGIPLTDAVLSRGFAVVTGHDPEALDWEPLTQIDTLVILMGGKTLPEIIQKFRQHRKPPQTPIAVIRWAGRPEQQVWEGTLKSIVRDTAGETLSPCVIVVGEVVRLRFYMQQPSQPEPEPVPNPSLSSSETPISQVPAPRAESPTTGSLTGKTVLVTRAATQSSQFVNRLKYLGARVVDMPALEIAPPSSWREIDRAISQLAEFDWLILTSANSVEYFFDRLASQIRDLRALSGIKIAAVGEKTAQSLKQRGMKPDFVPPEYIADSLAVHFPDPLPGLRMLFPRVESGGRDVLVKDFTSRGAEIVEVAAYQSRCPDTIDPVALAALQQRQVDIITFASSKTVKHFCQLLERSQPDSSWQSWLTGVCIASIGPQTTRSCQDLLGRVDAEAKEFTMEGLIAAIAEWVKQAGSLEAAAPTLVEAPEPLSENPDLPTWHPPEEGSTEAPNSFQEASSTVLANATEAAPVVDQDSSESP
mgnify:CR=1 FL=1